jgi:hypothetical protein
MGRGRDRVAAAAPCTSKVGQTVKSAGPLQLTAATIALVAATR